MVRLNKYLKDQGYCSRREADRWIAAGLILLNGEVVTEMGTKVDTENDVVKVQSNRSQDSDTHTDNLQGNTPPEKIYILLNKPTGYVTSMKRTTVEKDIVMDLINIPERVFPVGRLDKETSGMLILTNDGDFANEMTHPSFEHQKEYEVETMKTISAIALGKIRKGLPLFGQKTKPPEVIRIAKDCFHITLTEGKNRQIRRLVRKIGSHVRSLKRIRIGQVQLEDLEIGTWRKLSDQEVELCKM
jgi:23S rRNA pseudouridine2605 synthase